MVNMLTYRVKKIGQDKKSGQSASDFLSDSGQMFNICRMFHFRADAQNPPYVPSMTEHRPFI